MVKIIHINEKSDNDLISDYKKGKIDIQALYDRYANLVYGSCLKYFKNKPDAEDAVSEIFLLLSAKLKTHDISYFKSWLYTVTKNYCIEVLRKKKIHREKKNTAEGMYSESIFHPDDIEDGKILKKLKKCIDNLPDEQKQTINLFYYKKVSYKNIADKMEVSWDKVRSLIQNGRRNLKNCLESKT